MREGFKETFQPLIESQDAVKESIDKEQNELIKQLQENQLALTEGLDKNRLAITQGFDKIDEVKKWDVQQLPGFEATEEPEEEPEEEYGEEYSQEEPEYRISINDSLLLQGYKEDKLTKEGEKLMNISKEELDQFFQKADSIKINTHSYILIEKIEY